MQVNNPASINKTKYDNVTFNKINRPVAFAACSPSHPPRVRGTLGLAPSASGHPATGWRLSRSKVRQRAIMPSSTSQGAPETRPLVFRRSIPTQLAAKTPPLVFWHCSDNPTGTNNIALGCAAGIFTAGDNNINIGNRWCPRVGIPSALAR